MWIAVISFADYELNIERRTFIVADFMKIESAH